MVKAASMAAGAANAGFEVMRVAALLLIIAAAMLGCDAIESGPAAFTEMLLADAGFHRIAADSAPTEDLAGIPPREMVARSEGGKTVYVFVDVRNCRCVYVGSPEAYARYQEWVKNEEIARAMTWNDY